MNKYYPFKATNTDIIKCLVSEFQWLPFLKNRNKPYEILLNFLIEEGQKAQKDENNLCYQSDKLINIAEKLNIKTSVLSTWISSIYADILELNQIEPELFYNGEPFEYKLSFETPYGFHDNFNLWTSIEIDKRNTFVFPFIKGKLGGEYFYTNNIYIIHSYGKIITRIGFQGGFNNEYRRLVLDKAMYLNAIDGYIPQQIYRRFYDFEKEIKEYAESRNTGI